MSAANLTAPPGLLDRARTIAGSGYNRWLVPPCALAIHLCIGMAYGFSVFWLPLSKAIGITKSVACPKDARISYAQLTDRGSEKLREAGCTHVASIRRLFLEDPDT